MNITKPTYVKGELYSPRPPEPFVESDAAAAVVDAVAVAVAVAAVVVAVVAAALAVASCCCFRYCCFAAPSAIKPFVSCLYAKAVFPS